MMLSLEKKIASAVLAIAAAANMPFAAFAATYSLSDGETFELASGGSENVAGNRLDVSGSATLKLTGTATGARSRLS